MPQIKSEDETTSAKEKSGDGYTDNTYKKIVIGGKTYDVVSDGWLGGNTIMGDDGKRHYYSYNENTGKWSIGDISANQKKEDEKAAKKKAEAEAKAKKKAEEEAKKSQTSSKSTSIGGVASDSNNQTTTTTQSNSSDRGSWLDDYDDNGDPINKTETTKPTVPEPAVMESFKGAKTVITPEEAKAAGWNPASFPTLEAIQNGYATDANGYIDENGMIHLNSRLNEQINADVARDRAEGIEGTPAARIKSTAEAEKFKWEKLMEECNIHFEGYGKPVTEDIVEKFANGKITKEELRKMGYTNDQINYIDEMRKAYLEEYKRLHSTADNQDTANAGDDGNGDTNDGNDGDGDGNNYSNPEVKEFSEGFNKWIITALVNGDFGDPKKSIRPYLTAGYFILDKIAKSVINASEVARGMSPTEKSEWSQITEKQSDFLGSEVVAKAFASLPEDEKRALLQIGAIQGATAKDQYENSDPDAVKNAKDKDFIELDNLRFAQVQTIQENANALLERATELRAQAAALNGDSGWEAYAAAMNAYVGTAKGIETTMSGSNESNSSNKSWNNTLSGSTELGFKKVITELKFADSNTWARGSAASASSSNGLTSDALAMSQFADGKEYAAASREKRIRANSEIAAQLNAMADILEEQANTWLDMLGGVKINSTGVRG